MLQKRGLLAFSIGLETCCWNDLSCVACLTLPYSISSPQLSACVETLSLHDVSLPKLLSNTCKPLSSSPPKKLEQQFLVAPSRPERDSVYKSSAAPP